MKIRKIQREGVKWMSPIPERKKEIAGPGKINIRWSQNRGGYIVYIGRTASFCELAMNPDEALENFLKNYEVDPERIAHLR